MRNCEVCGSTSKVSASCFSLDGYRRRIFSVNGTFKYSFEGGLETFEYVSEMDNFGSGKQ